MTFTPQHIRVFIRPARSFPRGAQEKVCAEAAAQFGLDVTWYIQGEDAGDRDTWLKGTHGDEIAMIARLDMMTGPRDEIGMAPSADYVWALSEAQRVYGQVIEACTGITSHDGKRWTTRIAECAGLIARGRDLRPERAREMARASARSRSAIAKPKLWADPAVAEEVAALRLIWTSKTLRNNDDRFAALPADARERLGSKWMAYEVLDRSFKRRAKAEAAKVKPKLKPRTKRKT